MPKTKKTKKTKLNIDNVRLDRKLLKDVLMDETSRIMRHAERIGSNGIEVLSTKGGLAIVPARIPMKTDTDNNRSIMVTPASLYNNQEGIPIDAMLRVVGVTDEKSPVHHILINISDHKVIHVTGEVKSAFPAYKFSKMNAEKGDSKLKTLKKEWKQLKKERKELEDLNKVLHSAEDTISYLSNELLRKDETIAALEKRLASCEKLTEITFEDDLEENVLETEEKTEGVIGVAESTETLDYHDSDNKISDLPLEPIDESAYVEEGSEELVENPIEDTDEEDIDEEEQSDKMAKVPFMYRASTMEYDYETYKTLNAGIAPCKYLYNRPVLMDHLLCEIAEQYYNTFKRAARLPYLVAVIEAMEPVFEDAELMKKLTAIENGDGDLYDFKESQPFAFGAEPSFLEENSEYFRELWSDEKAPQLSAKFRNRTMEILQATDTSYLSPRSSLYVKSLNSYRRLFEATEEGFPRCKSVENMNWTFTSILMHRLFANGSNGPMSHCLCYLGMKNLIQLVIADNQTSKTRGALIDEIVLEIASKWQTIMNYYHKSLSTESDEEEKESTEDESSKVVFTYAESEDKETVNAEDSEPTEDIDIQNPETTQEILSSKWDNLNAVDENPDKPSEDVEVE